MSEQPPREFGPVISQSGLVNPDALGDTPASGRIRKDFPWWLLMLVAIILVMVKASVTNPDYNEAFRSIFPWPMIEDTVENGEVVGRNLIKSRGIILTLLLTFGSFLVSMFLGLLIGLGRIAGIDRGAAQSGGPIKAFLITAIRNISRLYIEFVRGIPMLVFIFVIAQVLTPDFASLINDNTSFELSTRDIDEIYRAGAALSLFYAAFIAEVFRAGIQSVPAGQIEAGRAIGLSNFVIMRKVVLPQAIRNMLPALGNDLISLMKDTSLVSVLAVRELTQMARLYTGSTFRFREGFFILTVLYVTMTLSLSLLLRWYEKRIAIPGY